MNRAVPFWHDSMTECEDTNKYFDEWFDQHDDFMTAEDWESTMQANYEANKHMVDWSFDNCLTTWN